MTIQEAWKIVGNQPRWAIKNMVKALSFHSWSNTAEEKKRLEAGKICLRHPNPKFLTNVNNS